MKEPQMAALLPLDEGHNGYCMTCLLPAHSDHDGYSECCNDRVTEADEVQELVAHTDTLDEIETVTESVDTQPTNWVPSTLRGTREALGLSRALVSKVTGLSSSIVWRSEQADAKPITPEQLNTLITQYTDWKTNGVTADIKPTRKPAAAKIEKPASDSRISELENKIAELEARFMDVEQSNYLARSFIHDLGEVVQTQIIVARQAKRATKELKIIEAMITSYDK